ncbi:MAG: ATP-binding cassette domain-containing protein, partial [Pseudomonadota bacterium]
MIIVDRLTRSYGDTVAVQDASFTIQSGEIVGLLGHNGAGKTTLMKMMTGFLEPTDGVVQINGRPLEENRTAAQALIGYLPENTPVYPDMSVV